MVESMEDAVSDGVSKRGMKIGHCASLFTRIIEDRLPAALGKELIALTQRDWHMTSNVNQLVRRAS